MGGSAMKAIYLLMAKALLAALEERPAETRTSRRRAGRGKAAAARTRAQGAPRRAARETAI